MYSHIINFAPTIEYMFVYSMFFHFHSKESGMIDPKFQNFKKIGEKSSYIVFSFNFQRIPQKLYKFFIASQLDLLVFVNYLLLLVVHVHQVFQTD